MLSSEPKSFEVLYEDEDLLVVNKASGLLSHRAGDSTEKNLEDLLRQERGFSPILFHRLDRGTSGALLVGKNKRWSIYFRKLFDDHKIRKAYWTVVVGSWPANLTRLEGEDFEGKPMLSSCRVLKRGEGWTLLEFLLKTGRHHQIRLQCSRAGFPVIGDRRHGENNLDLEVASGLLALHSRELRFKHPADNRDMRIKAALPTAWKSEWTEGLI